MSATNSIVTLNVGGHIYTTTRSTLTSYPDSMLGAMFGGDFDALRDDQGRYFIDRDGTVFEHVLNFLRTTQLVLPEDFKKLPLLEIEADFYQIQPLIEAVKSYKARLEQGKDKEQWTHDVVLVTFNEGHSYDDPSLSVSAYRPEVNSMVKDLRKKIGLNLCERYLAELLGKLRDNSFTVQSYGVVPPDKKHGLRQIWTLERKVPEDNRSPMNRMRALLKL